MPRAQDRDRDVAAIAATRDLLAQVGYDGFTMTDVAQRIGGSKPTLYRRWPSKADLVAAALTSAPLAAAPNTGNLREDLMRLAADSIRTEDALGVNVLAGVLWAARTNAELAAVVHRSVIKPRLEQFRAVLDAAHIRGDLAAVPGNWEQIADLLPAAVMYRFATQVEVEQDWLREVVERVILPLLVQVGVN